MRPAAYHLTFYAALLIASAAADVAAAYVVWRKHGSPGRNALCIAMLATAVWSVAYAAELSATGTSHRELWGALKYVGVVVLPPAWLVFALQYTGRGYGETGGIVLQSSLLGASIAKLGESGRCISLPEASRP